VKTIELFQPLSARPGRIFRALSDARDLAAWQADAVRNAVVRGRTVELAWPKLGIRLDLEVREVVADRKVVFGHGPARLELEVAHGGVWLRHTAPFDDDTLEGTASSWRIALSTLSVYLSRHAGAARRVHWAAARARGSAALCHAYFTERELLATWLGTVSGNVGSVDTPVALSLASGRRASGPVLANTPGRDVAIRWREADDSVLAMRTLPVLSDPEARTVLLCWSHWSDLPDGHAIRQELDRAIELLGRKLKSQGSA